MRQTGWHHVGVLAAYFFEAAYKALQRLMSIEPQQGLKNIASSA